MNRFITWLKGPRWRSFRCVAFVIFFYAAVPGLPASAEQRLGALAPQDIVTQIAEHLRHGDFEAVRPWLMPAAFDELSEKADYSQLELSTAGIVQEAEIVSRRSEGSMSYFEIKLTHLKPPPVDSGPTAALSDRSTYWIIGFDGEQQLIASLQFKTYSTPYELPAAFRWEYADDGAMKAQSAIEDFDHRVTSGTMPSASVLEVQDPRVVELFFATTRGRDGDAYSERRDTKITFGKAAAVRIPEDRKTGQIKLPGRRFGLLGWYEEKIDLHKHFVIMGVHEVSEDGLKSIIQATGKDDALIFVHGFNTTFKESIYRGAQIVWDLQYKGVPIVFSWPSWGDSGAARIPQTYIYDRDSSLIASFAFNDLLRILADDLQMKRIHILAHSMGSFLVLTALTREAESANPGRVSELIMAAPDVDTDQFLLLVPKVRKISAGVTLYASSADKAMTTSKTAARGAPRAGDVLAAGPVVLDGVDTIDVTALGEELLGLNHDVFASRRELLNDIGLLLDGRRPPNKRLTQIRPVPENPPPARYWRFAD